MSETSLWSEELWHLRVITLAGKSKLEDGVKGDGGVGGGSGTECKSQHSKCDNTSRSIMEGFKAQTH